MKGWISLHRKILDNPILTRGKAYSRFEAFVYMLLKANHKDNKIVIGNKLIKIKTGSFLTSQKKLMKEFNWGISRLRAFLKLLQDDEMIVVNSNAISTMITINNYSELQGLQTATKLQVNRNQTGSKSQVKTNNNDNTLNNDNNINKEQSFIDLVKKIVIEKKKDIPDDVIDDFCTYWTEKNIAGKKMLWEMQRTFDISRRLDRWLKNNKDWNVKTKKPAVNYKISTSGHYIGYCGKCNESSFYKEFNLKGDSVCCSAEILPERKND